MAKKATKLAAVNTIISNIGQSPVTSLQSGNPLVEMAEDILDEISRAVQAEGWEYNTERAYPFTPDSNKHIEIPTNVLGLDVGPGVEAQTVIRQGKLYNRVDHTYEFVGEQKLNVTWLFDFEDLPEVFKNYITIRAANIFAGRGVGADESVQFGQREETIARANCLEYDTQHGSYSFFADSEGGNTYISTRPYDVIARF